MKAVLFSFPLRMFDPHGSAERSSGPSIGDPNRKPAEHRRMAFFGHFLSFRSNRRQCETTASPLCSPFLYPLQAGNILTLIAYLDYLCLSLGVLR